MIPSEHAAEAVTPYLVLELPISVPLQIIDAEQRGKLSGIGASHAPVHVIHALANKAKSMLLHGQVVMYTAHHARVSDAVPLYTSDAAHLLRVVIFGGCCHVKQ